MSNRALVVIDIQNDYFPGGKWTLFRMEEAADNAAQVIEKFRENGDLVVHIRHEFPTDDAPFFAPNSEGAEIHKKVLPIDGEPVITKNQINSFRDTDLKAVLDRNGIEEIVFVGAMSHMCIDAAVRAANDFGYTCTVVHDACASRALEFGNVVIPAQQAHAAYMSALGFAYAATVSTEEFTTGLTKAA